MAETKKVRVSYVPTGHGLALTIAEVRRRPRYRRSKSHDLAASPEATDGVLRVTDACVTLELPMVDGRTPVLAWDPAEVDWEAMVA